MSTRGLLAVATALTGSALSLALPAPTAHADASGDIINTVNHDRLQYGPSCEPLKYRDVLKTIAQKYNTYGYEHGGMNQQATSDPQGVNYNGAIRAFMGQGDPEAKAINEAYQAGAGPMLSNCDYTEFGVSFLRNEGKEFDVVTIAFGKPAAPPPPPPKQAPPPPPQQAPPPDQAPPPPAVAPHDAIQVNITRAGLNVNVNVKNTANLAGKCTYVAKPTNNPLLPTVNRNFDIAAKGSTQLTFTAPPPLSTYHVVVSCHGSFNGKDVEFGHVEKDVSG